MKKLIILCLVLMAVTFTVRVQACPMNGGGCPFPDTTNWDLEHKGVYEWYGPGTPGIYGTKVDHIVPDLPDQFFGDISGELCVTVTEKIWVDPEHPSHAVFSWTVQNHTCECCNTLCDTCLQPKTYCPTCECNNTYCTNQNCTKYKYCDKCDGQKTCCGNCGAKKICSFHVRNNKFIAADEWTSPSYWEFNESEQYEGWYEWWINGTTDMCDKYGICGCCGLLDNFNIYLTNYAGWTIGEANVDWCENHIWEPSGGMWVTSQPAPEPATLLLLASGLAGLGLFGRKRFGKV